MPSTDLIQARSLLEGDLQIVLVKDDKVIKIFDRGITPWVEMVDMAWDLKGFSVATVHLSKAAAYLCQLLGISEVYAERMSAGASTVLEQYSITGDFTTFIEEEDSILDGVSEELEPEEIYAKLHKELGLSK